MAKAPALRQKIIAANFKMNLDHLEATLYTQKLAWLLADAGHDFGELEVLLLAPFTDLRSIQTLVDADKLAIHYGSQDVSEHKDGAYTGEISARQLAKLGVKYSLISHTERRKYHSETDEHCIAKAKRAIESGITPIVNIGETSEEEHESADLDFLFQQTDSILQGLFGLSATAEQFENIIISYEPRWSVGNGHTVPPNVMHDTLHALREHIASIYGEAQAQSIRLVYGGSVTINTAATQIDHPDVDGLLIGKAALDADGFSKIARVISKTIAKK